MKKLNKLQINSEKLMKNEELLTLRGGYGDNCCTCKEWDGTVINYIAATTPDIVRQIVLLLIIQDMVPGIV